MFEKGKLKGGKLGTLLAVFTLATQFGEEGDKYVRQLMTDIGVKYNELTNTQETNTNASQQPVIVNNTSNVSNGSTAVVTPSTAHAPGAPAGLNPF